MLLIIEYVAVIGFSIWGIVKVAVDAPGRFDRLPLRGSTRSPSAARRAVAPGLVLGVFFFWGWDTATNLNEESKNATKTPGHAGIIAMFLLLLIFGINIIAAQMLLPGQGLERPPDHHPAVLRPAGGRALGRLRDDHRRPVLDGGHHPDDAAAGRPDHPVDGPGPGVPRVFGTIQGKLKTPAVGTLILAFICMFGIVLEPTCRRSATCSTT